MTDLSEFVDELFEPKLWINQVCSQKVGDEPLEKFLAELEMRLQLTAEEIEASLQDITAHATRRIPFAVQEIYRLQGDIQGMQDQIKVLGSTIQKDASDAVSAVSVIAELDLVKTNMESAYNTLKEATELSGMFIKVEDLFLQGDLNKVADMLSSMRKSLNLVGDVPEFRAGRQKLKSLEDRLQNKIEGTLAEALNKSENESVRQLSGLLLAVDRYSTVESLYCTARLSKVYTIWEELSRGDDMQAWLPKFFYSFSSFLENESKWCTSVLPEHKLSLLTSLVHAVLTRLKKTMVERLTKISSIPALTVLMQETINFAKTMVDVLRGSGQEKLLDIMQLIYGPLEDKVSSYCELESEQLKIELKECSLPDISLEEPGNVPARLSSSLRAAFSSASAALQRCLALTGGTELPGLARVIDGALAGYLTEQETRLSAFYAGRDRSGKAQISADLSSLSGGEEEAVGTLRLVKVAGELAVHLSRLDTSLRAATHSAAKALAEVAPTAPAESSISTRSSSTPPTTPRPALTPDPLALRLVAAPHIVVKLRNLASSLSDSRFVLLRDTNMQVDNFTKTLHSTVYAVMLAPVSRHLADMAASDQLRRESNSGAAPGSSALAFSTVASAPIMAVGECLMALPQQLEVLMSLEGGEGSEAAAGEEGEELASQWLDKLVSGSGVMYCDAVGKITGVTGSGAAQIAADAEYMANVLAALHVAPPAALVALQLLAGVPVDSFSGTAKDAINDGALEPSAVKFVATLRKIAYS